MSEDVITRLIPSADMLSRVCVSFKAPGMERWICVNDEQAEVFASTDTTYYSDGPEGEGRKGGVDQRRVHSRDCFDRDPMALELVMHNWVHGVSSPLDDAFCPAKRVNEK